MFGLGDLAARIIGAVIVIVALFGFGYYKGHKGVQDKFDLYKAEVAAAAELQAQKVKEIEAKNKKINEETQNAYNTRLTTLRTYYGMRIAQSGGAVPVLPNTSGGSADYSADNLPPITTLAAQCSETTLTLYTLQNWVKDVTK